MSAIEELKSVLSESRVSTNETILQQHSEDESYHRSSLPKVVVYPETAEEVSDIVTIAKKHALAVTAFGVGSSLEGHAIPYEGGITVNFSLMNKIVEVRPNDFLVKVQPGVTREQLNEELKKYGLFFPVDPGADASIGGMTATNASGTTSVRYGIMRDQIRNLQVVLPDSSIIETGNLAEKSSSGYHLNGLFVGSEGTLGLFTEITLRVHGIPEHIMAARATFDKIDDAVQAVIMLIQGGIELARVELVDEQSIIQVNKARGTDYEVAPTLFLELHGNEAGLQESVEFMKALLVEQNVQEIKFEQDTEARNKLWEARHFVAYAYSNAYPGKSMMVTDVCVPFSELAEAVIEARKELEIIGLDGGIVGHVGDGNYHVLLMIDLENPEEVNKANDFNEQIVQYALERGGTCTGEHGVGVGKLKYQAREHGKAYDLMKTIKYALDPDNLFNPGKIID
ncbi:MAG TPA: FAD-linked oxidase C-terminal domain-containing protein [Pseudogracilibacillus sp.]|nr:FAD-linked oxidase C-terminal domain-containing protein [Pseudogracilibacillus sp.]